MTSTVDKINMNAGDFSIAALYIGQYGHWELPHTSHMFKMLVTCASNIVSLNRSGK